MFQNVQGFTLLELLIAAAIIGVLAIFATQSFRQTGSDIRIQNAKTGAQAIAMAARMFNEDHKTATFSTTALLNPSAVSGACNITSVTLQTLVDCGYLERRKYLESDFVYRFQSASVPNVCISQADTSRAITLSGEHCTNGETWNDDF